MDLIGSGSRSSNRHSLITEIEINPVGGLKRIIYEDAHVHVGIGDKISAKIYAGIEKELGLKTYIHKRELRATEYAEEIKTENGTYLRC